MPSQWGPNVPGEEQIIAAVGGEAEAVRLVDHTLGTLLRGRFDRSKVVMVTVLASQLPEAWLPRIANVQFTRLADDQAAKDFSKGCLRLAWIRSIERSGDSLSLQVVEGNRCSSVGITYRLRRNAGRSELPAGGRWEQDGLAEGFGTQVTHCGCS
jgi:hypothetical protein